MDAADVALRDHPYPELAAATRAVRASAVTERRTDDAILHLMAENEMLVVPFSTLPPLIKQSKKRTRLLLYVRPYTHVVPVPNARDFLPS